MLKPTGRIIASFFLVDEGSIGPIEKGATYPVFTERTDWGWFQDPMIPEDGVAFNRDLLLFGLETIGFKDVEIFEGSWRGIEAPFYQDLVVAGIR